MLSHSAALITAAFKEMSDSDSDCSQHGSAPLSVAESCTSQEYESLIAELDDVPTLNHSPSRGSSRGSAHGSAQGSPLATPKRVGKAASILSRATNSRELARVDTISFGTMVRATGLSIADSSPCTSADGSALPAGGAAQPDTPVLRAAEIPPSSCPTRANLRVNVAEADGSLC